MPADIERVLDKVLEDFSAAQPAPDTLRAWCAPPCTAPPSHHWLSRSAQAWLALAAAIVLLLGLLWYRGHYTRAQTAPVLAHEKVTLQTLPPGEAPPLTDEQQQLIQLLKTNPGALASKQPGELQKAKPVKHQ
ncbi:MAG: hypothetical protein ACRD01_01125 [Terriglobales bacterium]